MAVETKTRKERDSDKVSATELALAFAREMFDSVDEEVISKPLGFEEGPDEER